MSGAPIVVKLGGRALEAPGALAALAADLRPLAGRAVLVHGGGAEVTAWGERLGLAPVFHEGRRVTDEATLDVATAVLAGLANKRLVAALTACNVDAVGLAALDGAVVRVAPHAEAGTLGAVGQVVGVAPALLRALLATGRTPVLAPIGAHDGALLNLNADDVAAALAAALGAEALVLLSDTPGVRLGGAFVPRLDAAAAQAARASADVTGGMGPKLEAAVSAVHGGARRAWIGSWEGPGTLAALVADGNATRGTWITADAVTEGATHGG